MCFSFATDTSLSNGVTNVMTTNSRNYVSYRLLRLMKPSHFEVGDPVQCDQHCHRNYDNQEVS
jgi:hypothetical protein